MKGHLVIVGRRGDRYAVIIKTGDLPLRGLEDKVRGQLNRLPGIRNPLVGPSEVSVEVKGLLWDDVRPAILDVLAFVLNSSVSEL